MILAHKRKTARASGSKWISRCRHGLIINTSDLGLVKRLESLLLHPCVLSFDFSDCAEQKIFKLLFSDSDVHLIEDPKERPLSIYPPPAAQSSLGLTVVECENTRRGIKQRKAVCPEGVPGWGLKDYAEDLAQIFKCTVVQLFHPKLLGGSFQRTL